MLLCTIGSLIASGASFISAKEFGAKNEQEGKRIFSISVFVSAFVGIIFCALGLVLLPYISKLLSTTQTFDYVETYLKITLLGGVFKILLYIPFFYLRLEGKNKALATTMLSMTVLNILLDYIFMFVLDMGIEGAALASVAATFWAFALSFIFLFTKNSNFKIRFTKIKITDLKNIIVYGTPMALNNILSAIRVLFINIILKSLGISELITTFAIINNLNEFSICIQNGVPQAASAITGSFYGEKDYLCVKKLLNIQLVTATVFSLVFGYCSVMLSNNINHWFGSEIDIHFAVICFAISLVFASINSVMTYHYNAIGKINLANIIVICRGLLFVVLFCFVFMNMGNKIWLFYICSEAATLVLFVAISLFDKKSGESAFYMLPDSIEKSGKAISFSVDCSSEMICDASEKVKSFCESNSFTPKQTMAISLSIEEILTIIATKSLMGNGTMDVRVLSSGEDKIIRVRSGGKKYNPVEMQDDSIDYMGVMMITKLAKKIDYQSTLGINTLLIFI